MAPLGIFAIVLLSVGISEISGLAVGRGFYCPVPEGRFPDPQNCSKYYECRSTVAYPYQCPAYQLYDVVRKHCQDGRTVNCGSRPGGYKFQCPYANGRYADPANCSKYYECRSFAAYPYQCFQNQLYDERKQSCQDYRTVNCGRRPR